MALKNGHNPSFFLRWDPLKLELCSEPVVKLWEVLGGGGGGKFDLNGEIMLNYSTAFSQLACTAVLRRTYFPRKPLCTYTTAFL